ncbi:velvet factor [Kockovaella imperatae]|uniref:Velvet factor n=1 Tax=Kockovaella imperatae TaxID=4999 RepID=A0A1Y1UNN2_9TREE|nr:velvet factor [Kockovaella imperatae]ORX39076.1 velvet factor [Kockovaella imperatae]
MNLSSVDHGALGRTYRITPIQQPERSAAFQGAYLSRLPLSPPLIIQLDVWNEAGELIIPYEELPFLVCSISLETPSGSSASHIQDPNSGEVVSLLYGTLVTTPTEMLDQSGAMGVYFAFPDVSVRVEGNFRLSVNLLRITGPALIEGMNSGNALHTCCTNSFDIVPSRDYVAPPVTDLTRHFDAQGLIRFGLPRAEW